MATRLMHCPFCGETERIGVSIYGSGQLSHDRHVRCSACGACGPMGESATSARMAVRAAEQGWNENRITHEEDVALRTAFVMEN
jgi:Restriction alleviation protein Lar